MTTSPDANSLMPEQLKNLQGLYDLGKLRLICVSAASNDFREHFLSDGLIEMLLNAARAHLEAEGRERHLEHLALDNAWTLVNALGSPSTAYSSDDWEEAYNDAIGNALTEIEKLGGRDPLTRPITPDQPESVFIEGYFTDRINAGERPTDDWYLRLSAADCIERLLADTRRAAVTGSAPLNEDLAIRDSTSASGLLRSAADHTLEGPEAATSQPQSEQGCCHGHTTSYRDGDERCDVCGEVVNGPGEGEQGEEEWPDPLAIRIEPHARPVQDDLVKTARDAASTMRGYDEGREIIESLCDRVEQFMEEVEALEEKVFQHERGDFSRDEQCAELLAEITRLQDREGKLERALRFAADGGKIDMTLPLTRRLDACISGIMNTARAALTEATDEGGTV